mmetsp:Transcript_86754/g.172244  ORF Transcript_86754/g.172244 Transcript_86754/m.172244 type:complete len:228 (-) Transcript_86754:433-1116(-)
MVTNLQIYTATAMGKEGGLNDSISWNVHGLSHGTITGNPNLKITRIVMELQLKKPSESSRLVVYGGRYTIMAWCCSWVDVNCVNCLLQTKCKFACLRTSLWSHHKMPMLTMRFGFHNLTDPLTGRILHPGFKTRSCTLANTLHPKFACLATFTLPFSIHTEGLISQLHNTDSNNLCRALAMAVSMTMRMAMSSIIMVTVAMARFVFLGVVALMAVAIATIATAMSLM